MSTLPRILGFLRGHGKAVALAVVLGLATIGSNVGLLAVAAYLLAAAALKPLLLALSFPIYLVQLFGVSRSFLRYGERLVSHRVTLTLLARLRVWFFSRLVPLAPAALMGYHSGDLMARIVQDVQELENIYVRVVAPTAVALLAALAVCTGFALFSPLLALAAAIFLLAAGVVLPLGTRALAQRPAGRQPALRAALTTQVVDGMQGMQDVLAFGRERDLQRRLALLEGESAAVQRRMATIGGLRSALHDLSANLAVWTILVLAIPLIRQGTIHGVYLALLAMLMLGSFEALQPLGQALQTFGRSTAAARRLFEVADASPAVTSPRAPRAVPDGVPLLAFAQVSFSYRPEAPAVLEQIDFVLPPGGCIAIVGASGSGKSSIARLAVRVWDRSGGEIRLGGAPIEAYALDDLRATVGMVTQDTYIFTDTLRNNLLLARPAASDDDLRQVLTQARLDSLLERLPRGLDSMLGEQGVQISGGERQRVAIARAIVQRAPVLILDEATANLDTLNERALLEAVFASRQGRSLLIMTHRLVEMERMDQILVLDHGRIVERGTHSTLIAARGRYAQLYDTQNQLLALV